MADDHPERKEKQDQGALGTVFVGVAGVRFYDGQAIADEGATLVREPNNPHDPRAIRVDNQEGQTLGHVPRRTAAWLAPLLDEGRVTVKATVAEVVHPRGDAADGVAEIFLRLDMDWAGSRPLPDELSPQGRVLWDLYEQVELQRDPVAARRLGRWLMKLWDPHLEPAAKMLLAVMRCHGRALETQGPPPPEHRDPTGLRQKLRAVTIGNPLRGHGISVYPLFAADDPAGDTILLQDALAGHLAEVSEVSESGSVAELKVSNRSDHLVLIPEGEILVGAKQDRTINITLLVEPHSERIVPVSCVEQGRWKRTSRTFAAGGYATPGVRARKTVTVNANRRHGGTAQSDQGGVWEDIARYVADSGADSATGSLSHAFAATGDRLARLRKALPLPAGAAGVLVTVGTEVLGLDLFDAPQNLQTIWPRLADAYFLEAVLRLDRAQGDEEEKEPDTTGDLDDDTRAAKCDHAAAVFMEKVAQHLEFMAVTEGAAADTGPGSGPATAKAGAGVPLEVAGPELVGTGLWYDGRIRHLAAFPCE